MSLFGTPDELPEFEMSQEHLDRVLAQIKQNSRNRRLAMIAPVALAAAVLATLMAAPPRYGGMALVPDAEAGGEQLPRVFGSNGVWRLAEPIAESPVVDPGPASVIEAPAAPDALSYVLTPPDPTDLQSLPASTSTPPMSTPGQPPLAIVGADRLALDGADALDDAVGVEPAAEDLDWSRFAAVIRIDPQSGDASASASPAQSSTPDPAAPAQDTTTPATSSPDEDVTVAVSPHIESHGTAVDPTSGTAGNQPEANPSTPWAASPDREMQPSSAVASIVQRSVLVYSAHVSVKVQVVDDDSSVIDWCNTRVDWGDGTVTRVATPDGVDPCTATCEYESTPSDTGDGVGIDELIEFTHEYTTAIEAAPRIYVATGDGCNYTLAELQLNEFTVVPLR